MKKQLISIMVIGIAALFLGSGTFAYFSDTETSTGNTLTAGTIDISVDDENPWSATYHQEMKPCEVKLIEYTIKNVGTNDANIWKHLVLAGWDGGNNVYPTGDPVASSEPEYEEGGGFTTGYKERDFLPAWIICDLKVDEDWIFDESNDIRLDDLTCTWISLGTLAPGKTMNVVQSYHLMAWDDASESEVTNWAQGDVVTFDIEIYAVQTSGPGPLGFEQTLTLENKDTTYDLWEPLTGDNTVGTLTFNTAGSTFDYTFEATGLKTTTNYDLIYYADPYPATDGKLIATFTTVGNDILSTSGSVDLGIDIPVADDLNSPAGGKIWLVLADDWDEGQGKMVGWHAAEYLFGMNLIHYDDTDVV